jgi:hypothetical protein
MSTQTDTIEAAWNHGFNAVASRPLYAPNNPYCDAEQAELREAWDDGAGEAGINSIYTNGVLDRDLR